MTPRDFQRTRVYRAEWEMLDGREVLPDLESSWDFLTKVVRRKWFVKQFPRTFEALGGDRWPSSGRIDPDKYSPNQRLIYLHYGDRRSGLKLKPGYRRCYAEACYTTVVLPLWARNDLTLLHELAHICNFYEMKPVSAHGQEFVSTYLYLVKQTLGKEVAKELETFMLSHKVKVKLP